MTNPTPGETPKTIAARLDRLPVTPLHWASVVLCGLGLLFDVVEAALGNALSAVFSAPPQQVSSGELSLLLASVFIGGALGAPLLGWFADRHGRRLALTISLMLLAVTSLTAAAASTIAWLTAFRVLSGVALGAYPILIATYLADVLPPHRRGGLALIMAALGFLGAPAVTFLVRALTPLQPFGLEGWRWALIIGAIGAAAVGFAFRFLPESPRWLAATGDGAAAEAACRRFERAAGSIARPPALPPTLPPAPATPSDKHPDSARRLRGRAVLFGVLNFLAPWATIGFPVLSGAVLVQKGFRVSDSLLFLGISLFGPTLGVLAATLVVDRVERRTALALCGVVMAALGLAFAASETMLPLILAGIAFNLVGAIYVVGLNLYGAEVFPTRVRATVSSVTWAVNRVASALAPLALLPLLKSAGALAMSSVIAAALLASVLAVAIFGPVGVARRPVE